MNTGFRLSASGFRGLCFRKKLRRLLIFVILSEAKDPLPAEATTTLKGNSQAYSHASGL